MKKKSKPHIAAKRHFIDSPDMKPIMSLREIMGESTGRREIYGNLEQLVDLMVGGTDVAENLLRLLLLIWHTPDEDARYTLLDLIARYALIRTRHADGLVSAICFADYDQRILEALLKD